MNKPWHCLDDRWSLSLFAMTHFARHHIQMFSSKSDDLQTFSPSEIESGKTYIRRRIFFAIIFIVGSVWVFLFSQALNQFEIKPPNHIKESLTYEVDNYNLASQRSFNRATFENPIYCNISRCRFVICSSIPAPFDSGKEASHFIENTFKKECSRSIRIETLNFQNCSFLNNIIGPSWLQTDLSIDALSIDNCQLKEIQDEAFSLPSYRSLKSLSITGNNISTLRIAIFQTLVNLESLIIHDNIIKFAESNLLGNLADSLQILELHNSIKDSNVLKNITGQKPLPRIEIFSIQGNSLPLLSSEFFKGVPNVKSLYVDRAGVKEVMVDAFLPIAHCIKQLFMRSNSITTLRREVLETIFTQNSNFYLNIDDNPWHCDCNMKWLQTLIQKLPHVVKNDPVCRSPVQNAGLSFTNVTFCNDSEVSSSTIISTTIEDDSKSDKLINITCETLLFSLDQEYSRHSLIKMEYQFTKLQSFVVKEMRNGSILVNVANANFGFTLIWFSNEESVFNSENLKNNLKCVKSFRNSLLLNRLKPATSYTICLLKADEVRPSPLNCVALITSREYSERTWLSNGDKPLIISLSAILIFLLSLISFIVSYLVIRRNPTLLRGSKRVLIVRRRTVNAVVLPEGVQINSRRNTEINFKQSALEDHDYLTPLGFSQRVRKDSQRSDGSSQNSGASYISGIEPNLIQLATWRIHRFKNNNSRDMEKSPPLPPNHPISVPSLSYKVDFEENDDSMGESTKNANQSKTTAKNFIPF